MALRLAAVNMMGKTWNLKKKKKLLATAENIKYVQTNMIFFFSFKFVPGSRVFVMKDLVKPTFLSSGASFSADKEAEY